MPCEHVKDCEVCRASEQKLRDEISEQQKEIDSVIEQELELRASLQAERDNVSRRNTLLIDQGRELTTLRAGIKMLAEQMKTSRLMTIQSYGGELLKLAGKEDSNG